MKNRENIITHPSQLGSLSISLFMMRTSRGKIKLAGEMSNNPRKEEWEKQLNKHYNACGCEYAAAGLFTGFILGSAYAAYDYFATANPLIFCIMNGLAITVIGTLFGKLFGLIKARKKLSGVIAEIRQNWKVRDEIQEAWNCG